MSTKRWKLTVKSGGKTHEKIVTAHKLETAAWGLRGMITDLADDSAFDVGTEVDASVRLVSEETP